MPGVDGSRWGVIVGDIQVEAKHEIIVGLLTEHGLDPQTIIYVDNIQAWCRANGVPESDPWRAAKTLYRTGAGGATILLPKVITDDMVGSVTGAIMHAGFDSWRALYDDPVLFIKHLVLHEIHHVLDREADESSCDRWAFDQLHLE